MFTEALTQRLSEARDLWVVGSFDPNDPDLARKAVLLRPDVVTIDVEPLGRSIRSVLDDLTETMPAARLVVLTARTEPALAVQGARSGVSAWVPKERGVDELVAVLRGVRNGYAWYPPEVLGEVLRGLRDDVRMAAETTSPLDVLSARERDVLAGMAEGKRGGQIAEELFISVQTVRTHTRSILAKLNVHSQLEAINLARQWAREVPTSGTAASTSAKPAYKSPAVGAPTD